ncbi:MAG: GxxExxY protein [Treponema sp.]|nr:GxxExxY protein [Treponema sp.]
MVQKVSWLTRIKSRRAAEKENEFMEENEISGIIVDTAIYIHKKQLLTYLKLTNTKLGLILNFGSAVMVDGIDRIVNNL